MFKKRLQWIKKGECKTIKGYPKNCGVVTPITENVVSESYNDDVVNL